MSRRTPRALSFAALVAIAITALFTPTVHAGRVAKPAVAAVALTQLKVVEQTVTVRGRVTLPGDSARRRTHTRVAFALTDAAGKEERFAAAIDAKRTFKLTRASKLRGRLSLVVRVTIGGKRSGKALSRRLTIKAVGGSEAPSSGRGPATTSTPGGGASAPVAPALPQGTVLQGTFRFDAGVQEGDGTLRGTYFQMFHRDGIGLEENALSTARDKRYTLLRPGADGGLRTDAYQGPPTPAFAGAGGLGNSLANRITQSQNFHGIDFGIATAATDLQTGEADPLAVIVSSGGVLSGQLAAWTAQWNGQSFNQGSPKPDGTLPGLTTPVAGTYDATTGHYVLEWRSLIIGGPFNAFVGSWHLEGTFTRS